jgi:hypothetical protein
MPEASVVALAPVTLPPPVSTLNVTRAPATACPAWSRTTTDGSSDTAVPGGAVRIVDEFAVMLAALSPGPDESPQELSSTVNALKAASAPIRFVRVIGRNIRPVRAASRTGQGEGQRNDRESFLWPGRRAF